VIFLLGFFFFRHFINRDHTKNICSKLASLPEEEKKMDNGKKDVFAKKNLNGIFVPFFHITRSVYRSYHYIKFKLKHIK
jgi:hypothetical protein